MSKNKPYKEHDAASESLHEPSVAYGWGTTSQHVSLNIPQSDMDFLKELVKKMGWNMALHEQKQEKGNVSKRDIVNRLYGSIHLPEDFDDKQEFQRAIIDKYLRE